MQELDQQVMAELMVSIQKLIGITEYVTFSSLAIAMEKAKGTAVAEKSCWKE